MFDQNIGILGRRDLLRLLGIGSIGVVTGWLTTGSSTLADDGNIGANEALQRLMDGNRRFQSHHLEYPHQSAQRLQEVAYSQQPFAIILSCADSRVPTEIVFDEGIGDLFDIRVAGNIVTPEVLGSVEYAVALLGTRLIMVLGHERCGAVTAAVTGEAVPGSVGTLVKAIAPALKTKGGSLEESIDKAVVANVQYQIQALKRNSPLIEERLLKEQLKIVGGRYDLDTGEVVLV